MNIETIIQNCGTYFVTGQLREGKQTEINRISNPQSSRIVDITYRSFRRKSCTWQYSEWL